MSVKPVTFKVKQGVNVSQNNKVGKMYWDDTHGDVELWSNDANPKHIGSLDPLTMEIYKPAAGHTWPGFNYETI